MTASTTHAEVVSLIDYAETADIGGDPLVVDLVDSLEWATQRIHELEEDLLLAEHRAPERMGLRNE